MPSRRRLTLPSKGDPARRSWIPWLVLVGALSLWSGSLDAQTLEASRWGIGFNLESFVGSIDFADSTYLDTQKLFGGLVGLDFGRGVRVRGYYWRGADEDFGRAEPIEGYGGEIQFDLNLFSALKPFLVAGIGEMDFGSDFRDKLDRRPEGTTTYILGGGLALDVSHWLRVHFSIRDNLFKGPEAPRVEPWEPEDEPSSDPLRSNLMWSGGIAFTFGGRPGRGIAGPGEPAGAPGTQAVPGQVVPLYVTGQVAPPPPGAATDSLAVDERLRYVGTAAEEAVRTILAVELGHLDAVFPESAVLGEERAPITGSRADTLELRVTQRLHDVFEYLAQEEAAAIRSALEAELAAQSVGTEAEQQILAAAAVILQERVRLVREDGTALRSQIDSLAAWTADQVVRRRRVAAYFGGNLSNGGQFLLGGQMGINAPWSPSFAIVPEVTLGFGSGGVSALAQGSLRYFAPRETVQPYAGLGAGVLVLSEPVGDREGAAFVLVPTLGVEVPVEGMRDTFGESALGYFLEYQAVGFFDLNRVLLGANWRF